MYSNSAAKQPDLLRHLAAIVLYSNDAIISKNLDGMVVSWNPAAERMYGYAEEEMLGQPVACLIPPGHDKEEPWLLSQIRQGLPVEHFETVRTCKNGQVIFVSLTVSPILDAHGVIMASSQIARNITERNQAAASMLRIGELDQHVKDRTQQLEQANQALEQYAYSVAHDLRRPLRHVISYSEILSEEAVAGLSTEHASLLKKILTAAQRMGELIDTLLEFSRSAHEKLHCTRVDLGAIVEAARAEIQPDVGARIIDWKIGPLPPVLADAALLKQVLVNLLSNAVKYSRPQTAAVIEIGAREENGEVICFVRDNGVGFDMQHVGKLFGVFQRLHHADEFEGTGIGLAHVSRIVQRLGGRVWAEGQLGVGATFYFSLPQFTE